MRQVLVEAARRRNALKRPAGADAALVEFDDEIFGPPTPSRVLALDDALVELAHVSPRQAQVVEARFFGGLSMGEIAEVVGVSEVTVFATGEWPRLVELRAQPPLTRGGRWTPPAGTTFSRSSTPPSTCRRANAPPTSPRPAPATPTCWRTCDPHRRDREDSVLDTSTADVARDLFDGTDSAGVGARIGPYRLTARLGEGGSGVVHLAERDDIGSRVAIKLLRDAWVSPDRRERFWREQRTLAQLHHPAIASIIDAGTLEGGTPWFAMEYVGAARSTSTAAPRAPTFPDACAWSDKSAPRCSPRTDAWSCIATSSRRTSWSPPTARRSCSTSASPASSRAWMPSALTPDRCAS